MVKSHREIDVEVAEQERLFIASIPSSAPDFARAIRSHWSIENKLHWVLDMIFRDNQAHSRKDHGRKDREPKNLSVIKHMAINIVRTAKTKQSIRVMRKEAGRNNQILRDIVRKLRAFFIRFPCQFRYMTLTAIDYTDNFATRLRKRRIWDI